MNSFFNIDWMKVVKGAVHAGIGAAVTYITTEFSHMDFGPFNLVIAGIVSVISNIIHKWYQQLAG